MTTEKILTGTEPGKVKLELRMCKCKWTSFWSDDYYLVQYPDSCPNCGDKVSKIYATINEECYLEGNLPPYPEFI